MNDYDGRFLSYHEQQPEWGVQYEDSAYTDSGSTGTWSLVQLRDGSTVRYNNKTGEFTTLGGASINPESIGVGAPQKAAAPEGQYDAQGKFYEYRGGSWVANPQFDNPTKAAGYRAPAAAAAPLQPHVQVAQNGDVYRIDPYTGVPTLAGHAEGLAQNPNLTTFTGSDGTLWTINPQDPASAKSTGVRVAFSQQDVRAQQLADAQAGRDFTAAENATTRTANATEAAAGRAASSAESATNRAFQAGESGIDRAIRASEFASNYGLQQQQEARAVAQYNSEGQRQSTQDALAAAEAYAKQISATDPAALPAFLMAGGGNIANAIHSGATALSDNAVLPAARTLQTIETAKPFQPISYVPQAYTPPPFTSPYQQPVATGQTQPGAPTTTTAPVGAYRADGTPGYTTTPGGGVSLNAGEIAAASSAGAANGGWQATPGFAYGTDSAPIERYATGSFITGDSTDPMNPAAGGAHPEQVTLQDPPGPNNARATVDPLTTPGVGDTSGGGDIESVASLFRSIADFLDKGGMPAPPEIAPSGPRFAFGTDGTATLPTDLATPADQPYIDRVRALRTGIQEPSLFDGQIGDQTYNAGFFNQPTAIRNRVAAVRQDVYGVPSDVSLEQAQQYAIRGVVRGTSSFGR